MGVQKVVATRDEIVEVLRGLTWEHGDRISIKKFTRLSGIPERQIYLHFDSWGDVRVAAGLKRHIRQQPWYSHEDILAEFHKVVQRLGRYPACLEFTRHSEMNAQMLFRRFGSMRETVGRYREWLNKKKRQENQDEPAAVFNPQGSREDGPQRDVRWMRKKWFGLRVGFELNSSHFKGRPATCCDLLVVLRHDWPVCPVQVLELSDVLRVEE